MGRVIPHVHVARPSDAGRLRYRSLGVPDGADRVLTGVRSRRRGASRSRVGLPASRDGRQRPLPVLEPRPLVSSQPSARPGRYLRGLGRPHAGRSPTPRESPERARQSGCARPFFHLDYPAPAVGIGLGLLADRVTAAHQATGSVLFSSPIPSPLRPPPTPQPP